MKRNKMISLVLSAVLLLAVLAGCGEAESSSKGGEVSSAVQTEDTSLKGSTLNLFTWEGMFPQEVLDGFTEETGVKINYVNFDFVETAISEDLVQKLDPSKLSNYKSINPVYQGQFFDPEDEYTVPYGAGVQTIVYDPSLVDLEITGYADLWDKSLEDSVGIIASSRVIDGMALKVLGESYNTEDISKIEAAGQKLLELAPNIRLIKDDNTQDDLLSGEISAAVMYTSQVTMAKMQNPELKVVFPKEGIGFGIMAQFIPSNAPNAEAAYLFMDYILRPEISAKCYEFLGYYCTNKDADALISEEYREFLTLPEDFKAEKMEMIENISAEALEAHEKVWTAFKSACE